MKDILKNILIVIGAIGLSLLLADYFSNLYVYFFPQIYGGGFFAMPTAAADYLLGLPFAYQFFVTILFTAFGGAKKYWWIGILLIPPVLLEIFLDFSHIYFPILLGLVGWTLGWGISKMMPKPRHPVSA